MSLLQLDNIVKEYRNQCVLDGVSLRVERGERVGLVGPNGAGKTTLLRIALGREVCDRGSVILARNIKIGYLGQDLLEDSPEESRSETALHYDKVYRLEQKLRAMEVRLAEGNPDDQALLSEYSLLLNRYEAMDGYTIETKIKKILLGLGLRPETLYTPLSRLSGGEKMRVLVARLLLEEPDLLVLDEPTNHLDIQATEWFENFLKKFTGGILFVSHDRYFLDRVATRVAELDQGNLIVLSGSYSNFIEHKQQLGQHVANEQRRLRWTLHHTNEKVQGLKSRGKIRAAKSREKSMEKLTEEMKTYQSAKQQEHLHRVDGPRLSFKKIRHVSKDIAWAEGLQKSFGAVTLFTGASFHIRGRERVGIIGPNGCGKSTLINMLLGHDRDYTGFLRLGEWVKYSYMGQEILFANEAMTVIQLILDKREVTEAAARDHLARFQFYGEDVVKTIQVLSGGERVRLYLAVVMLEEADCLILDEPTNHLDAAARDAVETALEEYRGTIIAVTHDRYFLTRCVNKILEIEGGRINTYEGNYDFYKQVKYGVDPAGAGEPELPRWEAPGKTRPGKKEVPAEVENPGKERQAVEAQIISLENRMKEMEGSFDAATLPEKYREYDDLLRQVESLYRKWSDPVN